MSPRRAIVMVLAALVCATLACNNNSGPDPNAEARVTGLAQTAAALLTATAQASVTPATATLQPTLTPIRLASTDTATAPPPAATNTAPPPPATATACPGNDSDFVSDVNVPDGTHFAAGTVFQHTWRLRNSGTCTWTTAYQLRYVSGDAIAGASVNLTAPVPPGATTDITVTFTAPSANGNYTSRWQLFDEAGTAFGTKPYVQINVP